MISKLDYSVTFSNERTLSQSLTLQAGSTLITGKNGQGKSLTFEMIAFALFGSAALRGATSDYKKIKLEVEITILDKQYILKRTKSGAKVFNGETQIVSGTSPVNAWVVNNLGYGYDVFRIAHWCAQGDIQALATMRPTERKAMIDSVAGLTQMDSLMETIKADARVLRSEIDAALRVVTQPVAPEKPDFDSASLEKSLADVQAARSRWAALSHVIQPIKPMEPQEPQELQLPNPPSLLSFDEEAPLPPVTSAGETGEAFLSQIEQEKPIIERLIREREELETKVRTLLPYLDQPHKFPKGYRAKEKVVTAWELWAKREQLNALEQAETFNCPHCDGEVSVAQQQIDELKALSLPKTKPPITVDEWDQIATNAEQVAKYKELQEVFSIKELTDLRNRLYDFTQFEDAWNQHNRELAKYLRRQEQVKKTNASLMQDHDHRVTELEIQHKNAMLKYNSQKANFDNDMTRYAAQLKDYEQAMTDKAAMVDTWGENPALVLQSVQQTLNEQFSALSRYEAQYDVYLTQKKAYDDVQAGLTEQKAQLEDLNRAREALRAVKSRVQTHLIPSLNKVASFLVAEMTGGDFKEVIIDDQFEVFVDKQPLRTLSGSGKDIANLALRIALGRILTHKVLPLMMLDEIDSAMDSDRAAYTWDCITRITPNIGQVLQASHKELEAEMVVTV